MRGSPSFARTFGPRGLCRGNAALSGFLRRLRAGALAAACVLVNPLVASGESLRIVAVGDSITAGLGLGPDAGLVAQLQAWLTARGEAVELVNAGVSGDTTAGGLARLDWSVGEGTDGVILALGANDMLRGMDPAAARDNLAAMLARLAERQIPTLLAGMRAGANLGPEYAAAFDAMYPELAERFGVLLYPFLLAGVALQPALNQADGIHPNARGVAVIVEGIGPHVLCLLEQARAAGAAADSGPACPGAADGG